MTGKKKRGLLSWLGFGDEEKAEQPTVEQQSAEEGTDTLSQTPSQEDSIVESVVEDAQLEQSKETEALSVEENKEEINSSENTDLNEESPVIVNSSKQEVDKKLTRC